MRDRLFLPKGKEETIYTMRLCLGYIERERHGFYGQAGFGERHVLLLLASGRLRGNDLILQSSNRALMVYEYN